MVLDIKRNIRKTCQKESNDPKNPQCRATFEIAEDYKSIKVTKNGNEEYVGFVVYDSALDENGQMKRNENGEIIGDEDRIIIFATEYGLIDMLGHRHWAGDATFDSCPELFYQLLTMHCSVGKDYVPRLFCLMPDKKGKPYDRLFEQWGAASSLRV